MFLGLETKVKTKPLTNNISGLMYQTSHLIVIWTLQHKLSLAFTDYSQ